MKTIEELASEAGARDLIDVGRPSAKRDLAFNAKQLTRFAALVRAEALEEAAKVCEALSNDWHGHDGKYACEDAANRLRALKDAK